MERVGLFGGSFDPPTLGHLAVAQAARSELQLNRVEFVPVHQPVHRAAMLASSEQRLAMLELMLDSRPGLAINPVEIERDAPSYSVSTLENLTQQRPGVQWFWLLGTDAFNAFESWYRPQRILELCHLVVMSRPGYSLPDSVLPQNRVLSREQLWRQRAGGIYALEFAALDVSSTRVRADLQKQDAAALQQALSAPVLDYIHQKRLYQAL